MKICVIGAGLAGLVSAKYCLEYGHEVIVYEQTSYFGGCWHYTDKVGFDEYGLPVHSAMYKDLRTNLPKEIMNLEGLEYPEYKESYITQEQVLNYIENYVQKFKIESKIKYLHHVSQVFSNKSNGWSVTFRNLKEDKVETSHFDALMVCNGHYFKGVIPNIPGNNTYKGIQIHSHDFRKPKVFEGKTIIVVGAGPSGVDIVKHCATVSNPVYISRKEHITWHIPEIAEIIQKPEIESFTTNGCRFTDGTHVNVDVVIYCTGYAFEFPFLTKDCKIEVENNWVKHLYRHLINIHNPTMAIVGLQFGVSVFPIVDLMARYFLAHLSGHFVLPSKEEMLESELSELKLRNSKGWPLRYAHKSPDHAETIMNEMAAEANIRKIPPVTFKLHRYITKYRSNEFCYNIIDDNNFVRTK